MEPSTGSADTIRLAGRIYDALKGLDPRAFVQGDPRRSDDETDIDGHFNLRMLAAQLLAQGAIP